MQPQTLEKRVERLETKMLNLEQIPERVTALEVQIVQLRDEMRGEFSALRAEMHALNEGLRTEMHALNNDLRAEMRALNEETRRHMLVLHEEVIERIKLLGEANGQRRSRAARSPRKRSK